MIITGSWQLKTGPAVEPVSLEEAKTHLRIEDDDSENDYITTLIKIARQQAEEYCWRAFITQTWNYYLDEWPVGLILIPRPRLIAVSTIKYYDGDNVQQDWSSSNYQVDTKSEPGRVALVSGEVYPTLYSRLNAVDIEYTAGYGAAASDVPEAIGEAIKLLVSKMFEFREPIVIGASVAPIPRAVESLLDSYRTGGMLA